MQNSDAAHPIYTAAISLASVAADGLINLRQPNPGWRNPSDCGEATYTRTDGSVLPLNCDGPKHVLIKDADGSFLGTAGAATGHGGWAAARHASGVDQGSPLIDGTCVLDSDKDAYLCATPGVDGAVALASGYQQSSPPPAGLFGEPELFVLESRDKDTEDRNFSPVALESSGALCCASVFCDGIISL